MDVVSALRRLLRPRLAALRRQRDPQYEFDLLITSLLDDFNAVLNAGRETLPEGTAREVLKARAAAVVTRLANAIPPTPAWRELVDDYLQLMEIHLRYFGDVLPEDAQRSFAVVNQRANDRRESLRRSYRGTA